MPCTVVRLTCLCESSGGSRILPRGAPTPKVGVLTYFFGRKLHENERIWTRGVCVPGAPLRSATGIPPAWVVITKYQHHFGGGGVGHQVNKFEQMSSDEYNLSLAGGSGMSRGIGYIQKGCGYVQRGKGDTPTMYLTSRCMWCYLLPFFLWKYSFVIFYAGKSNEKDM